MGLSAIGPAGAQIAGGQSLWRPCSIPQASGPQLNHNKLSQAEYMQIVRCNAIR
jgi:hypothetical protein